MPGTSSAAQHAQRRGVASKTRGNFTRGGAVTNDPRDDISAFRDFVRHR
jgi:hypothetical protein